MRALRVRKQKKKPVRLRLLFFSRMHANVNITTTISRHLITIYRRRICIYKQKVQSYIIHVRVDV